MPCCQHRSPARGLRWIYLVGLDVPRAVIFPLQQTYEGLEVRSKQVLSTQIGYHPLPDSTLVPVGLDQAHVLIVRAITDWDLGSS